MTSAGPVASLHRAVSALHARDTKAVWQEIGQFMDSDWAGVDHLIVSAFYTAAHKEWPGGPTGVQVSGFVRFLEERYDDIVSVPTYVTEAIVRSVFTGDYTVFGFVPQDTLLTLQLLIVAAITAHRRFSSDRLMSFLEAVARSSDGYRQTG
jgi:hypothetical protein